MWFSLIICLLIAPVHVHCFLIIFTNVPVHINEYVEKIICLWDLWVKGLTYNVVLIWNKVWYGGAMSLCDRSSFVNIIHVFLQFFSHLYCFNKINKFFKLGIFQSLPCGTSSMTYHYSDIKFSTLGQFASEIWVVLQVSTMIFFSG